MLGKILFDPRRIKNLILDMFSITVAIITFQVSKKSVAMSYERVKGKLVIEDDNNSELDNELMERQENATPGSGEY